MVSVHPTPNRSHEIMSIENEVHEAIVSGEQVGSSEGNWVEQDSPEDLSPPEKKPKI